MDFRQFPRKQIVASLLVLLVGTASFGLGRLSVLYDKQPLQIDDGPSISEKVQESLTQIQENGALDASPALSEADNPDKQDFSAGAIAGTGSFVASKSGEKYYPVGCASANRIKEENRVYFETADEAEKAGYEATTTCKD